jgi:hypothetical protein
MRCDRLLGVLGARVAGGPKCCTSLPKELARRAKEIAVSRDPLSTLPPFPQPPRTKLPPSPLDSERFLRYLLGTVVAVGALLVAVSLATIFLA